MVTSEIPPDLIGQSGLYNVSDPLLRRLRLQDTIGHDIMDLQKYFNTKEILIFYAGSEQGIQNLKEFHRHLTVFSIRQMKSCSVIYVSTDTDPACPERILTGQAWLRMVFHDNSDFAPMIPTVEGEGKNIAVVEDVARGEEFVQAGEIEVGVEKISFGEDESQYDYVRPLSRAAVSSLMKAYSTPSVAIYHLPTHQFIARNVKISDFQEDKIDKIYHTWRNGGTPSLRVSDVLSRMKWPLIFLVLAVIYRSVVFYAGDEYNVIPRTIESLFSFSQPK